MYKYVGMYILKSRNKFILLPLNSSLNSTWYHSLGLLSLGREEKFFLAFIAKLKTRRVNFKVSSCLSQAIATNLDRKRRCHHAIIITTIRHFYLCLTPLSHHGDHVATRLSLAITLGPSFHRPSLSLKLPPSHRHKLITKKGIVPSSLLKKKKLLLQAFLTL